MSTNSYIEFCRALRSGNIRATVIPESQEKVLHNITVPELEQKLQATADMNEILQSELQDSRSREASLRLQNDRLRNLIFLYTKKTKGFNQTIIQAQSQAQGVLDTLSTISKNIK